MESRAVARLSRRQLAEFSDYVAAMLGAGLALPQALAECGDVFSGRTARFAAHLCSGLSAGNRLSDLLSQPEVSLWLPPIYRNLLSAGEHSDMLARSLEEAALHLREEERARSLLIGSAVYPVSVLILLLGFTVGIIVLFIPRAVELLRAIPEISPQQIDQITHKAFVEGLFLSISLSLPFLLIFVTAVTRKSTKVASQRLDALTASLPLVGRLVSLLQFKLFVFAIEALCSRGFPVEAALLEAAMVLENHAFRASVESVVQQIECGTPLPDALATQPLIPDLVRRSLSLGDSTGTLSSVLPALSQRYRWEVERRLQMLAHLAEPALILVCGTIVLVVVATLVVPVFALFAGGV